MVAVWKEVAVAVGGIDALWVHVDNVTWFVPEACPADSKTLTFPKPGLIG